jgi:tetratricopeptide (TPR) repeat protein
MAAALIEVAEARVFANNSAAAEPLLRQALEINRKKLPPGYPGIITAQVRLGEALTYEGKAAAAEPILREALSFAYAPPFRLPEWQVGETESALGWCLAQLGRVREAETLLRKGQAKLANDPRPIFCRQAAAHLAVLTLRSPNRSRTAG